MTKKTQTGTVIFPDGNEICVLPANGREFSLQEMQTFVGGHIEQVKMAPGNGHALMYVDEEGKLKSLPINRRATKLALCCLPPHGDDVIVGPALVVKRI